MQEAAPAFRHMLLLMRELVEFYIYFYTCKYISFFTFHLHITQMMRFYTLYLKEISLYI